MCHHVYGVCIYNFVIFLSISQGDILISIETYIYILYDTSAVSLNEMEESTKKTKSVNYQVITPRFSVQNNDELQQGVEYLTEHGYAVFSDILTNDEINNGIDLLWKHLENLKKPCYIRRDNPETWDMNW